jgi:hypothetical protein
MFGKTQGALASNVADPEKVIDFEERVWCALLLACLAALFALN